MHQCHRKWERGIPLCHSNYEVISYAAEHSQTKPAYTVSMALVVWLHKRMEHDECRLLNEVRNWETMTRRLCLRWGRRSACVCVCVCCAHVSMWTKFWMNHSWRRVSTNRKIPSRCDWTLRKQCTQFSFVSRGNDNSASECTVTNHRYPILFSRHKWNRKYSTFGWHRIRIKSFSHVNALVSTSTCMKHTECNHFVFKVDNKCLRSISFSSLLSFAIARTMCPSVVRVKCM